MTEGRETTCYARAFENVKILDFHQSWGGKMEANVTIFRNLATSHVKIFFNPGEGKRRG